MAKFGKGEKKVVKAIQTSSMPDVVFMLLFFFMVTTVMREVELKVSVGLPAASQVKKLEDKALVSFIYIGKPTNTKMYGELPRIQLNDVYADPENIRDFIAQKIENTNEVDRNKMTVSLKIDKKTEMGIVTDVKQELRKASALKINYSSYDGDVIKELSD